MNAKRVCAAWFLLVIFAGLSWSGEPASPGAILLPPTEATFSTQNAGAKEQPKVPDPVKKLPDLGKKLPEKKLTDPPQTDIFAPQPLAPQENSFASFNPNMIGDLLKGGNSVSYFLQRSTGAQKTASFQIPAVIINGTGATNITNPSVAENNSAIPRDRVSFRYNFFENALGVTGDSGQSIQVGTVNGVPVNQAILTTKKYNVQDFTFAFEKTFLNGNASIEMRLPFSRTLSYDQTLSVANVVGYDTDQYDGHPGEFLITKPTPDRTLGQTGTEIGNLTLILKAIFYQTPVWTVSGGLALGVPTARATHTQVIDYLGDTFDFDTQARRIRDFNIANETWSLSPFLAFLVTPTDRWFVQGFVQYDQPIGLSRVNYTELVDLNAEPFHIPVTPSSTSDRIREQSLLHLDVGVGGWLFRNPDASWVRGVAPTVELHYTTTLQSADIRTLPANALYVAGNGSVQQEPNPTVGNLRNRVDILDLTLGSTFLIKDTTTVALGFTLPLRGGDNRTFDWEFQVQCNYYFR